MGDAVVGDVKDNGKKEQGRDRTIIVVQCGSAKTNGSRWEAALRLSNPDIMYSSSHLSSFHHFMEIVL